jgi:hypothetical protein
MFVAVSWRSARMWVIGVVAMLSLVVLLVGSASAAPSCQTSSGQVTCVYGFTHGEQTFVVPAWVSSVQVTAVGANGAPGQSQVLSGNGSGGFGAVVSGRLSVSPGQTLYVEVGGNGFSEGGFNGGGSADASNGIQGGNGGGASVVRTVSRATI